MKESDPRVSPVGWYLAAILTRFIPNDQVVQQYAVNELLILIKADSPTDAYNKAVELAEFEESDNQIILGTEIRGRTEFVGFGEIIPIYDPIEHGCEVLDTSFEFTGEELRARVLKKGELAIFSAHRKLMGPGPH